MGFKLRYSETDSLTLRRLMKRVLNTPREELDRKLREAATAPEDRPKESIQKQEALAPERDRAQLPCQEEQKSESRVVPLHRTTRNTTKAVRNDSNRPRRA